MLSAMKSLIIIILAPIFLNACNLQGEKKFAFEVCNMNPYPISVTVDFPDNADTKDFNGPLEKIECKTIHRKFRNYTPPSAQIRAMAQNTSKLQHIHNFTSDDFIRWYGEFLPKKYPELEEQIEKIENADFKKAAFWIYDKKTYWDFFTSKTLKYIVVDPYLTQIFPADQNIKKDEYFSIALDRAHKIDNAVYRQMDVRQNWRNKQTPYYLGANVDDYNGSLSPGVILKDVVPTTLFGGPSPFRSGDIFLAFNNEEIFSPEDLYYALHIHATSQSSGIEKPYKYKIIRNDRIITGKTTYLFNEDYWGHHESEKADAAGYGFLSAATLGFAVESRCAAPNALVGVANTLAWAANKLNELSDTKRSKLEYKDFYDYDECYWKKV